MAQSVTLAFCFRALRQEAVLPRRTFLKRSRTREAPTPTNISTNSDPEMEKNGTPASPAIALASSVLPAASGARVSACMSDAPGRLPSAAAHPRKHAHARLQCNLYKSYIIPTADATIQNTVIALGTAVRACARRADQQHALGDACADRCEAFRPLQELHHLHPTALQPVSHAADIPLLTGCDTAHSTPVRIQVRAAMRIHMQPLARGPSQHT